MESGLNTDIRTFPRQQLNANNMKNKIKEFRARYGYTQEELAERAGVRRETIVFLEQNKYNPSLALAMKIARELETTIDELFSMEG
jgi:putative transcriptional regulator